MTEDEMVGWHHRFNGHEFEQIPGAGDEEGSLACCSPGVSKSQTQLERLNNNIFIEKKFEYFYIISIFKA